MMRPPGARPQAAGQRGGRAALLRPMPAGLPLRCLVACLHPAAYSLPPVICSCNSMMWTVRMSTPAATAASATWRGWMRSPVRPTPHSTAWARVRRRLCLSCMLVWAACCSYVMRLLRYAGVTAMSAPSGWLTSQAPCPARCAARGIGRRMKRVDRQKLIVVLVSEHQLV